MNNRNVYCAEFAHNIVCLLHHYVQNCTNMCRQLLSMQNLHCLHIFGTLDKGCRNLPSLDTRPPNNGLDEYAEFPHKRSHHHHCLLLQNCVCVIFGSKQLSFFPYKLILQIAVLDGSKHYSVFPYKIRIIPKV